ncbi:MAG TPA: PadR family transcriptional regulator [Candidatus Acidoferrales bacterium]|nr:PadR family transcriptional regulator [Candidatus Acidoferrales bacterium]
MRRKKTESSLTTPDLVLLSLLSERPMHGYEANLELERREIRDWAAVSRPQVYYSLEKLARLGFLREVASAEAPEGPERRVLATTVAGRAALAHALERSEWATQRERPAFLIWLALSWRAESRVVKQQIARRREFVERELVKERETLQSVLTEVGHRYHEAVWMITLVIEQFEAELLWLKKLEREIRQRGKALHAPEALLSQRLHSFSSRPSSR